MVPADCSAFATPPRTPSWSAYDDRDKKISGAAGQSGNRAVLGSREAGQVSDQALYRLRRAALFSALDLPVLLFRPDGVGGKLGRGNDLYLQPDAQIGERALCDRLRHAEGRAVAADQFRRPRSWRAG